MYQLNGGENATDNPRYFSVEDEAFLSDPTRFGFIFIEWQDVNNNKLDLASLQSLCATISVAYVYAIWAPVECTVYLQHNGTTTVKINFGSRVTTLPVAVLNLHDFVGWKSSATGEMVTDRQGRLLQPWANINDVYLVPVFIENRFTVGGIGFDITGDILTRLMNEYRAANYRVGHVFDGFVGINSTQNLLDLSIATQEIYLVPKWKLERYTIHISDIFGNHINFELEFGDYFDITLFQAPVGYEFVELRHNGSLFDFIFMPDITIGFEGNGSLYLDAILVAIRVPVSFNGLEFEGTINPVEIAFDSLVGTQILTTLPTFRGRTLLHFADADGVAYIGADGKLVKTFDKFTATTLTAIWQDSIYTVTFNSDGGSSVANTTFTGANQNTTAFISPTKLMYRFVRWEDQFGNTIRHTNDLWTNIGRYGNVNGGNFTITLKAIWQGNLSAVTSTSTANQTFSNAVEIVRFDITSSSTSRLYTINSSVSEISLYRDNSSVTLTNFRIVITNRSTILILRLINITMTAPNQQTAISSTGIFTLDLDLVGNTTITGGRGTNGILLEREPIISGFPSFGYRSANGGAGGEGFAGVQASTISVRSSGYDGALTNSPRIIGGTGGNGFTGENGANGANGTTNTGDGRHGKNGTAGGNGGNGGRGGFAVVCTTITTETSNIALQGGIGGNGGAGGRGGNGGHGHEGVGDGFFGGGWEGGNGGNGGRGGNGGNAGTGGSAVSGTVTVPFVLSVGSNGTRGTGGAGGSGGIGGLGGTYWWISGRHNSGAYGSDGARGTNGAA